MTPLTIYIGNTTVVELQALKNNLTDAAITNATVVVTLTDTADVEVAGQTWPLILTHVSAGTYRATLENDLVLTANRKYKATIDATVSGVGIAHWVADIIAEHRVE